MKWQPRRSDVFLRRPAGSRHGKVNLPLLQEFEAIVGEHVVEVDGDARIQASVLGDDRRHPVAGDGRERRDANASLALGHIVAQVGDGPFDVVQQMPGGFLEQGTLGGQRHVARITIEQAGADFVLQPADHAAERRLRDVHVFCGAREIFHLAQGEKRRKQLE